MNLVRNGQSNSPPKLLKLFSEDGLPEPVERGISGGLLDTFNQRGRRSLQRLRSRFDDFDFGDGSGSDGGSTDDVSPFELIWDIDDGTTSSTRGFLDSAYTEFNRFFVEIGGPLPLPAYRSSDGANPFDLVWDLDDGTTGRVQNLLADLIAVLGLGEDGDVPFLEPISEITIGETAEISQSFNLRLTPELSQSSDRVFVTDLDGESSLASQREVTIEFAPVSLGGLKDFILAGGIFKGRGSRRRNPGFDLLSASPSRAKKRGNSANVDDPFAPFGEVIVGYDGDLYDELLNPRGRRGRRRRPLFEIEELEFGFEAELSRNDFRLEFHSEIAFDDSLRLPRIDIVREREQVIETASGPVTIGFTRETSVAGDVIEDCLIFDISDGGPF
ncbi:MAG: hypothetical protein AB4050_18960 [Synechococcus sp.]